MPDVVRVLDRSVEVDLAVGEDPVVELPELALGLGGARRDRGRERAEWKSSGNAL